MFRISSQETRRLFGPLNRPHFETNVRHRAVLRKALELVPPEQLAEVFHQDPTRLRVAMGLAFTFSQLGKIKTTFVSTHLPTRSVPPTDTPSDAQRPPCVI
jgi:hypothetical protein